MPLTASPAPTAKPLWRGIASALEDAIVNGDLPCGSRIPGEPELVSLFKVSRPTVVKAVRHLAAHGLVERRQGLGTFVTTAQRIPPATLLRLHPFSPVTLRPTAAVGSSVNIVAISDGEQVGVFHVDADPEPWKSVDELVDLGVLAGSQGWTGCRRHTIIDLPAASASADLRLRIRVGISDEFSVRHCRITALLSPRAFDVDIEEPS